MVGYLQMLLRGNISQLEHLAVAYFSFRHGLTGIYMSMLVTIKSIVLITVVLLIVVM